MMKKNIKILILITTIFLFTGCTTLLDSMGTPTEPKIEKEDYYEIYGLIENGKINRYSASKDDIDKVRNEIYDKYGIKVESSKIRPVDGRNYIKFYNDFIVTTQRKQYTIPRTKIKFMESPYQYDHYYEYKLPVNRLEWDSDIILDIGEIEIYDKDGKVIKEKTRIPPILFRHATITRITYFGKDIFQIFSLEK